MPGHHTTRDTAVSKNVNEGDKDAVNRWRRSMRRWTLVPGLLLTVLVQEQFEVVLWLPLA